MALADGRTIAVAVATAGTAAATFSDVDDCARLLLLAPRVCFIDCDLEVKIEIEVEVEVEVGCNLNPAAAALEDVEKASAPLNK